VALSREQVVATAVDLLGRYGLADLSMRRLARELGVAPGALYWHVANKQELLVEVADALLADVVPPRPDLPPAEALAASAVAIRDAIAHVPDAGEVVGLAYAIDADAVRPLRDLARLAGRVGAPSGERQAAADLVVHHVLGSVMDEQNQRQARALDPTVAGRTSAELAKAFEVGLGVILRGLSRA
jgi:AcrR family transcriptional regulator